MIIARENNNGIGAVYAVMRHATYVTLLSLATIVAPLSCDIGGKRIRYCVSGYNVITANNYFIQHDTV